MKLSVLLSVVPGLTAVFVFRTARRWCEHQPGHRPWLIAASLVVLGLVGVLVPKVFVPCGLTSACGRRAAEYPQ
jgi:H+/Cl- antiporter ClcA